MFRKRECCVCGNKVVLVPYSPHHVPKYHEWMQDPVLRAQTASEPLTLQEEYDMQQKWLWEEDIEFVTEILPECTFIVLDKELYEQEHVSEEESMVGDVNMFLSKEEEGEGGGTTAAAEVDIMIAEPASRGKGFGLEATRLMMMYGVCELGIRRFRSKISTDNKASIGLFKNRLKFKKLSESEVFREITLELDMDQVLVTEYEAEFKCFEWTKYARKTVSVKDTET